MIVHYESRPQPELRLRQTPRRAREDRRCGSRIATGQPGCALAGGPSRPRNNALRRRWNYGMPEAPDLTIYCERIVALAADAPLTALRILNPFVLRTVTPVASQFSGQRLRTVQRIGKRLALGFEGQLFAVIHLMRAGRLRWITPGKNAPARSALALLEFEIGTIALTEAGTRRRASLHLIEGELGLAAFDAGGVDPITVSASQFARRLRQRNHTLKRALADPTLVAGIGGAYADEILFRARLSPLALTQSLDDDALARLHHAMQSVLAEWTNRLRAQAGTVGLPDVTAFHPAMAVHGKFGQPCPECGSPVQRIVYAERETNYCARCQTGGRILADRALSRLLKDSFPASLDELE